MNRKYKTVDLFSGIGGIRRAFEMTGFFENVISAEIDKYACKTYKHIYGVDPFNDVTSEDFKIRVENLEYDVLMAGFPCQAFSIAGKKEGFKDKIRGTLFFDVADIIERTKPKAIFLENVEGLVTHKKGSTFKTILEVLIFDLGYKIIGADKMSLIGGDVIMYDKNKFIRNTKDFGLPQKRSRTYIVGFREDIIKSGYIFEDLPLCRSDIVKYKNLRDLLEMNAEIDYYVSSGYLETLKKHRSRHKSKGNGFGYEVVNAIVIENPIANTILATGGSGKERNLVYDPQDNISGVVVSSKQTPINSEGIRHMTTREWGKLQGFVNYAFLDENGNDAFSFPDEMSKAQQYKQFGNSVSIPVVEMIAKYINENLNRLDYE